MFRAKQTGDASRQDGPFHCMTFISKTQVRFSINFFILTAAGEAERLSGKTF